MDTCATSGGWQGLQHTLDGPWGVALLIAASVTFLLGRRWGWLAASHVLAGTLLTAATWFAAGAWDLGVDRSPGFIGREWTIESCARVPGPHRGLPAAFVVQDDTGARVDLLALLADLACWSCLAGGLDLLRRRLVSTAR